mmetsp:Transcript_109718/g.318988  ORF Transcript_109718/g.318988 Transcript_109718/m.318988 type:complete len:355 (-) Transcript_109718:746-1810(-)
MLAKRCAAANSRSNTSGVPPSTIDEAASAARAFAASMLVIFMQTGTSVPRRIQPPEPAPFKPTTDLSTPSPRKYPSVHVANTSRAASSPMPFKPCAVANSRSNTSGGPPSGIAEAASAARTFAAFWRIIATQTGTSVPGRIQPSLATSCRVNPHPLIDLAKAQKKANTAARSSPSCCCSSVSNSSRASPMSISPSPTTPSSPSTFPAASSSPSSPSTPANIGSGSTSAMSTSNSSSSSSPLVGSPRRSSPGSAAAAPSAALPPPAKDTCSAGATTSTQTCSIAPPRSCSFARLSTAGSSPSPRCRSNRSAFDSARARTVTCHVCSSSISRATPRASRIFHTTPKRFAAFRQRHR